MKAALEELKAVPSGIWTYTVMNCCECIAEKSGVYYNYFRATYSGEIGIKRELGTEIPRESEGFIT